MKTVSILMSAISGYGYYYLKTLIEEIPETVAKLCGVIDPEPARSGFYQDIIKKGIPIFLNINEFYSRGYSADLVVISSPIQYHVSQSITALENNSFVLCDKPAGATVQDVYNLIKKKNEVKKWVEIGYQWSFSDPIQSLKKDILSGIYGQPVRLKSLCFWPRDYSYYERNDWAGKIKDEKGKWILDSPANNAYSHFIHNMLFLLGENMSSSAVPESVIAELYKAYDIENYDTVAARIITSDDVELLFYGSHITEKIRNPLFELNFEEATIFMDENSGEITAKNKNGQVKNYGSPDDSHQFQKLYYAIDAVNKKKEVICGPEAAMAQTICINGMQDSFPEIIKFSESMLSKEKNRIWVNGLGECLSDCYKKSILPSEGNFAWAKSGNIINLKNYVYFPEGKIKSSRE
ncbi:Gfo/Idh/MocA family protein [Bacteroidota bacterium]